MLSQVKHFFILGAAKCGTSSLYYYLDQHPDILMSTPKETLFFEKEYHNGADYFRSKYYPNYNGEIFLGEARHRNLYLPFIAERLAKLFPDAKLIVMLRNPIDRAYSHYVHCKNRGIELLSFKDAIEQDMIRINKGILFHNDNDIEKYFKQLAADGASLEFRTYIDCGYYAEQIERYMRYFDKQQILITFTEDFKKNAYNSYINVLKFLDTGLQPMQVDLSVQNSRSSMLSIKLSKFISKYPRLKSIFPKSIKQIVTKMADRISGKEAELDEETRMWLVAHYKDHNTKLGKLTGRDFSHWNK